MDFPANSPFSQSDEDRTRDAELVQRALDTFKQMKPPPNEQKMHILLEEALRSLRGEDYDIAEQFILEAIELL